MRLLRLRLRNYRGVLDSEVRFQSKGVTIVEGPNEAGKSSLAEAIGILFDHLDSTSKREVKALKPVHLDEGTEIEAQIETGPYAFTYFKRFHKRPETRLTIERPQPESLTGREAHERVAAILRETIDDTLWKALRIEQGAGIDCPKLAGQTRLSAALDSAAGSAKAGEREESLFDASREEYLSYFTEGGQERRELKTQDEKLEHERERRRDLENRLRALDSDIARSATLRREISQLADDESRLARSVQEHEAKLENLARLEDQVAAARAQNSEATLVAKNAEEAASRRGQLVDDVSIRTKAHAELAAAHELSNPERERATLDLKDAQAAADEAKAAHDNATQLLALRQKDRAFRDDEFNLQQILERKSRIEQARREIVDAERILGGAKVTDRTIQDLKTAEIEVERTRAGLAIKSPRVELSAHAAIAPLVDGEPVRLDAGHSREWSVERSLTVTILGVADFKISAGESAVALREAFEKAQRVLDEMLESAGVPDVTSAGRARDARREAARIVKERTELVATNLRDLSEEQFLAKVVSLRARVDSYEKQRVADVPLPVDLAEAKKLENAATDEAERLSRQRDASSTRLDGARTRAHDLLIAHAESQANVKHAAQAIGDASAKLERARAAISDENLESRKQDAVAAAIVTASELETAEANLAEAAPEDVKALAANARQSAEDTSKRHLDAKGEFDRIIGRLQVSGEEGLGESLDAAAAACSRLELDLARTRVRAAAAKLLFDTLEEARKEAHGAYVAPLQEQIEKLGRLVFGPSLRVSLDDSLAITSRTLEGVTVPFDGLSGGTQEQLSLLERLACAIVVAKDGGAPLILDDALGYTDRERLETMGAALARAGESCQIIILTCMPERYGSVGGATRVRLGFAP